MKDISKVKIPTKYKELFLLIYNPDNTIFGGTIIPKKNWKKTYTKFVMALTLENKPFRLELHGAESFEGNVNVKDLIMEEIIDAE